jgi:hypothetical protein
MFLSGWKTHGGSLAPHVIMNMDTSRPLKTHCKPLDISFGSGINWACLKTGYSKFDGCAIIFFWLNGEFCIYILFVKQ